MKKTKLEQKTNISKLSKILNKIEKIEIIQIYISMEIDKLKIGNKLLRNCIFKILEKNEKPKK